MSSVSMIDGHIDEPRIAGSEKPGCVWCISRRAKTDLSFSVIDDDFGQPVSAKMIRFCPFCGRSLSE